MVGYIYLGIACRLYLAENGQLARVSWLLRLINVGDPNKNNASLRGECARRASVLWATGQVPHQRKRKNKNGPLSWGSLSNCIQPRRPTHSPTGVQETFDM